MMYQPEFKCPICEDKLWVHPSLANNQPDYTAVIKCRCQGDNKEYWWGK